MRYFYAIILFWFVGLPGAAQDRIVMDSEGCEQEINILVSLFDGQVLSADRILDQPELCLANHIVISAFDVTLRVASMHWSRGKITELKGGKLSSLKFGFFGTEIQDIRSNEPVWKILAEAGDVGGGVYIRYIPENKTLDVSISFASLSMFPSLISIITSFKNVSPAPLVNPKVAVLGMTIDQVQVRIKGGVGVSNSFIEVILAQVQKNNPDMTFKHILAHADKYIVDQLASVLSAESMVEARHILADMPRLEEPVFIEMRPANNFPVARFSLLAAGVGAAAVFDEAGLMVSYGTK